MLQALSIRDFAIIDAVEFDLRAGLTVVTGETGAGKSILINALNLVLGGRAKAEVVRAGAASAQVEALFDLRDAAAARARLEAAGIEAGGELVVRRVVARSGRHRVYLNGTLATVQMLGEVTRGLVDISGQHEHYSLLRTDFHLELIDRVGALAGLRDQVGAAYGRVAALDARADELRSRQRDRAEREDFLRFQLRELDDARLEDADEETTLENEASRLRNTEKLRDAARQAEADLYADQGAAAERLARSLRAVETLAELDPELAVLQEDLASALAIAEDAARTLGDYGRDLAADPQRLDEVESRLALFAVLRRKYGATLAEVIERAAEMRAEVAQLSGAEDALAALADERRDAAARLLTVAEQLSAARRDTAVGFVADVGAELADLGMAAAELVVELEPVASGAEVGGRHVGPRGIDRVELRLSANPGSPPMPLNRIASGGELSRFMLAVKRVIAAGDPVGTYVFDEVDSGIGGPTAEAVGRKLQLVSRDRQAVCITHLPQIAALGDHHLVVRKSVEGERTRSSVEALSAKARVEELARMLGGATVTKTTRAHARELLKLGRA